MNGRTDERTHRPEKSRRPAQTVELQTLELQMLELLIASGESLDELLEEWALNLTALGVDARTQN